MSPQETIMKFLKAHGPATRLEIAQGIGARLSCVDSATKRLEIRGAAAREDEKVTCTVSGRRVRRVRLTGAKLVDLRVTNGRRAGTQASPIESAPPVEVLSAVNAMILVGRGGQ